MVFDIASATSTDSLTQLKNQYTANSNQRYVLSIYNIWYTISTVDNDIVECFFYYSYAGGSTGGTHFTTRMEYDTLTGLYDNFDGTGGTVASGLTDGLTTEELTLLEKYYSYSEPILTLTGDNPYEQTYGTTYTEPGYTILDSNGTNVSSSYTVYTTGTVNVNTLGQYTLTYSASSLTSVDRIVDVVDNIAPVIVLEGDNPYVIEPNSTYTEPGYTATDNHDGNITNDVIITGDIETSTIGINTVKYTVTDAVGNTTEVTRLVQVGNMNDSILPVITLQGNNPFYLDRNSVYQEPGYTAQDQVDLDTPSIVITSSVEVTSNIDNSTMGEYEVIYSVTDGGGNTSRVTRTVIVQAGGLMEVETYTGEVYFTVDTTNGIPIMISNTHIKSNFDVAYRAENSGRSVVGIHRIWVEKGTGSSGLIYASPVVYLWVFYSHKADNSEEISYESRKMNYDLQLNEWTYTSELVSGTIRSTGITVSDEINLIRIYSNMPQVPMFSKYQARKLSSLVQLKEECITDVSIGGVTENDDNIIILELWYDMSTSILEYVDCIANIQITRDDNEAIEYKTLYLSYNNDTKLWVIPSNRDMINSTLSDNKITEIEKVYPDPDRGSQDYVANPIYNDTFISFYTKPIGVSVHNEGIRYLDNSLQTTAMPPTGTVLMYACEDTPSGWIDCDGSLFSKDDATMIDLFNTIGYTYGGDGQSSFRIPNLNGRFPIGADSTLATNDMYWDEDKKQGGNKEIQKTQFIHKHTVDVNIITTNNIVGVNRGESGGDTNAHRTGIVKNTGNVISYNSNTTRTYEPSYTIVRYLIKI
jgi:microcystin-dependent protein